MQGCMDQALASSCDEYTFHSRLVDNKIYADKQLSKGAVWSSLAPRPAYLLGTADSVLTEERKAAPVPSALPASKP